MATKLPMRFSDFLFSMSPAEKKPLRDSDSMFVAMGADLAYAFRCTDSLFRPEIEAAYEARK